jgi:hypothetical protein
MFSGRDASGAFTSTIEMINFAERRPRWRRVGNLIHPSNFSKAVLLPNGKIFLGHGLFPGGATFEQRAGLRFQIFDPKTGITTPMAATTVVRGLHGTATLLPGSGSIPRGRES